MSEKNLKIAFIGGGNMALAILSGLLKSGTDAGLIHVIEPLDLQRDMLREKFKVYAHSQAGDFLNLCDVVVWAVKPQIFTQAAPAVMSFVSNQALHISVMAGIRCRAIKNAGAGERVVRAMPNTPALIGAGITGLFSSRDDEGDRSIAQGILQAVGKVLWVNDENQLDTVTALSGSGPAYVFYFLDAMQQAGTQLGLDADSARKLAEETFIGAAKLAAQSSESLDILRERVTSKGGTTHAAISEMQNQQVSESFVKAMHAASQRAKELGDS